MEAPSDQRQAALPEAQQYFPKGYDFRKITPERLAEVEEEINERPRKTLGYACPNDLLDQFRAA